MTIRKARIKDSIHIQNLIHQYADQGKMLPRAINEIYENIRDFWIKEDKGEIVGCVAFHVIWEDLGEVKSLAVSEKYAKKGTGKLLLEKCIADARELGVEKIFSLTYIPDYFKKFGFKEIPKDKLPHKIWSECIRCPKFPDCGEVALLYEVS